MTRDEILSMQPGPELDVAVFEPLFGKKVACWESGWAPDGCWSIHPGKDEDKIPHFVERCFCDGKPDISDCYTDEERRVVRETGHSLICFSRVPPLSTSWEGMRIVVEAMRAKGWLLILTNSENGVFDCTFYRPATHVEDSFTASFETAPHAICLAALLAMEGEQCQ